jgi:hypothetical protein
MSEGVVLGQSDCCGRICRLHQCPQLRAPSDRHEARSQRASAPKALAILQQRRWRGTRVLAVLALSLCAPGGAPSASGPGGAPPAPGTIGLKYRLKAGFMRNTCFLWRCTRGSRKLRPEKRSALFAKCSSTHCSQSTSDRTLMVRSGTPSWACFRIRLNSASPKDKVIFLRGASSMVLQNLFSPIMPRSAEAHHRMLAVTSVDRLLVPGAGGAAQGGGKGRGAGAGGRTTVFFAHKKDPLLRCSNRV